MRYPDDFAPNTAQEWDRLKAQLLEEQDWRCDYCEQPLVWKTATFEHAIPRCKGGTDHVANLVMACKRCNCSKGGRSVWQWRDPADYAAAMAPEARE